LAGDGDWSNQENWIERLQRLQSGNEQKQPISLHILQVPHGTYTVAQSIPATYRSNGIDITDSVISARGDERTGRQSGLALLCLSVAWSASLPAHDDFGVVRRSLREALGLTRHADPCDATRQPFPGRCTRRAHQAIDGKVDPVNGCAID